MQADRRALSGRQRVLVLAVAALVGAALGWLLASRNPLGHCEVSSINTGTRLDCASAVIHDGSMYLLITNEPSRTGDDIAADEAGSAVAAVMPQMPSDYAGVCYERMGIDAVPTCTARPVGSSSSADLRLDPPERAGQDTTLIVVGTSLFCICVAGVAAIVWPSKATAAV